MIGKSPSQEQRNLFEPLLTDFGSTDIYGEKGALCEDFGESKEEEVVVFNSSEI